MSVRKYEKAFFLMERVTEPELMNEYEQVKAYSEADFSSSDADFVTALEFLVSSRGIELNSQSLIIDLGCGPGNITERIACKWPKANVFGIDGSAEMLRLAKERKENIKTSADSHRISYVQCDLKLISKEALNQRDFNEVDLIVSNSLLHHIHDPKDFWNAIKKISIPGTIVFHRDLRRPDSFDEAVGIQKKYQTGSSSILNRDFLASLCAAFTVKEVEMQLKQLGLFQLKVFEVGDRYLEVNGII